MKVERIAECFLWSSLQCFCPALSDNRSSFELPLKPGCTVFNLMFVRNMQLIAFSCLS